MHIGTFSAGYVESAAVVRTSSRTTARRDRAAGRVDNSLPTRAIWRIIRLIYSKVPVRGPSH